MKAISMFFVCPAALLTASAAGVLFCRLSGMDPHLRSMVLAAGICLISSGAALVPLLLNSAADPATRFQAAWIGTILHMGLAAVLSIAAILVLRPGTPLVYWLLLMFWTTLIGLCAVMVRWMRQSAPAMPAAVARFGMAQN